MRRKKLANKIISILMAGMMVAATPMSALAGEITLTDDTAVVWQNEEESNAEEESVNEEITLDENDIQNDLGQSLN